MERRLGWIYAAVLIPELFRLAPIYPIYHPPIYQTLPQRMQATLHAIKTKLRKRMHEPVNLVGAWLKRVVSGYYQYHAVPDNQRALRRFRNRLCAMWRSMLGRRSQRSRPSYKRMRPTFERWIPRSRVLHPFPDVRFDATHPR